MQGICPCKRYVLNVFFLFFFSFVLGFFFKIVYVFRHLSFCNVFIFFVEYLRSSTLLRGNTDYPYLDSMFVCSAFRNVYFNYIWNGQTLIFLCLNFWTFLWTFHLFNKFCIIILYLMISNFQFIGFFLHARN